MIKCKDCKYVRNCETSPDTNADECETFVKLEIEPVAEQLKKQEEEQKEKDCNNCTNATEDFNDELDTGCYMCCKGVENNYVPIK